MNCDEVIARAPLYVTGELESWRAAELDAHLKTCPACMREIERQARLDARLRAAILADEASVMGVDRRVRELIAAEDLAPAPEEASVRRAGTRWAVAAMGIAAAAVLAIGGYRALGNRVPQVYADAAQDHHIEVIEQQPRRWLTEPALISALAEKQGIAPAAITALTSGSYRLVRGKLCFLDGRHIYLHLVLSDGNQEFSVFLRKRDATALPGKIIEISNGKPLCTSNVDREHMASLETPQLDAVIVTDESSGAALDFARFASAVL